MPRREEYVSEKRLVNRLHKFWQMMKQEDEEIPEFSKFNQNKIADMWENCVLFSVVNDGLVKMYHCEYVGLNLKSAFGKDLTGKYTNSKNQYEPPGRKFIEYLDKCLADKEFIMSQGSFVNDEDRIVKYRDCIMPFRSYDGKITHIVAGVSWKAFD